MLLGARENQQKLLAGTVGQLYQGMQALASAEKMAAETEEIKDPYMISTAIGPLPPSAAVAYIGARGDLDYKDRYLAFQKYAKDNELNLKEKKLGIEKMKADAIAKKDYAYAEYISSKQELDEAEKDSYVKVKIDGHDVTIPGKDYATYVARLKNVEATGKSYERLAVTQKIMDEWNKEHPEDKITWSQAWTIQNTSRGPGKRELVESIYKALTAIKYPLDETESKLKLREAERIANIILHGAQFPSTMTPGSSGLSKMDEELAPIIKGLEEGW